MGKPDVFYCLHVKENKAITKDKYCTILLASIHHKVPIMVTFTGAENRTAGVKDRGGGNGNLAFNRHRASILQNEELWIMIMTTQYN